jgi:peptide/nickel transport system substrate-binding protein
VKTIAGNGQGAEILLFNVESPPLDDPSVRQALMFAVDRQAVVDRVKALNPGAMVLNCGILALPDVGPWCTARPFEEFTYDPAKARQILESDGYDCSRTPCTKRGRPLVIPYLVGTYRAIALGTAGVLVQQARSAGLELELDVDRGNFGAQNGPRGAFTVIEVPWDVNVENPSLTSDLSCEAIPKAPNHFAGANWGRWCDREATELMHQSDVELDPQKRLDLMTRIYEIEARDAIALPLYVRPAIIAYRTDQVAGPIGDYLSSPMGSFWNMDQWFKPGNG